MVDLDIESISYYLKHPSKEPDYRGGRSHGDFLIGLSDLHSGLKAKDCQVGIEANLVRFIEQNLGDQLDDPQENHIAHLMKRVNSQK